MRVMVLIYFFLMVSFLSNAQNFKGGVQAGLAVSQIAGDGMSGYHKAGLQGGFFVSYRIKDQFSLQMELAYIQKGSARAENIETGENQYLRRLNYIEWPLVVQYHLQQLKLEAGISADFLASSYEEINFQLNDQNGFWRKTTFNTVFGIRYLLNSNVQFVLRSINSINSIRSNSVPLNVRRYSRKYGEFNDVLLFGVAYQF